MFLVTPLPSSKINFWTCLWFAAICNGVTCVQRVFQTPPCRKLYTHPAFALGSSIDDFDAHDLHRLRRFIVSFSWITYVYASFMYICQTESLTYGTRRSATGWVVNNECKNKNNEMRRRNNIDINNIDNNNNNNNNVVNKNNNNPYASAHADTTRSRFRSLKPSARAFSRSINKEHRLNNVPIARLRHGSPHQPCLRPLYVQTFCNNRMQRVCRRLTVYVSDFDKFLMRVVWSPPIFTRTCVLSARSDYHFDTLWLCSRARFKLNWCFLH